METTEQDRALRPTTFDDFVGQAKVIENLRISVSGAKSRGEALDHILLACFPGAGKSSLAHVIANEMGSNIVTVNCQTLKSKGELVGLLIGLKKGDILFLDEIHSLSSKIEEILYSAMEDYKLEIVTGGSGAVSTAVTLPLAPFTLIGATTREGMLSRPLRDRFGEVIQMQPYTTDELTVIVTKNAAKLGMHVDPEGARILAQRARGTPRIANRLLRRVRDFTQYRGSKTLSSTTVEETCARLGIDSAGLDHLSQMYLKTLTEKHGPVSLKNITSLLNESEDTILDVVEPHLARLGYIEFTSKGRVATRAGIQHYNN